MSSPSQPAHLSNHHRTTLRQIFQHPAGHNIEWRAVLSLLEAVGSAEEQHGGKVAVTIGSETEQSWLGTGAAGRARNRGAAPHRHKRSPDTRPRIPA